MYKRTYNPIAYLNVMFIKNTDLSYMHTVKLTKDNRIDVVITKSLTTLCY